jgi:hypothetical protein
MAGKVSLRIRQEVGKKFKKIIEERLDKSDVRELDAISGKDFSWISKFQKGEINFTIDSLSSLMAAFKIQPGELFDFKVEYPKD